MISTIINNNIRDILTNSTTVYTYRFVSKQTMPSKVSQTAMNVTKVTFGSVLLISQSISSKAKEERK